MLQADRASVSTRVPWHRRRAVESQRGAVVYTAANESLVMLEMLVQDQPLRARYVMSEARIPSGVTIDRVSIDDLPSDW